MNMPHTAYEDRVLLKIRREYSKDEAVKAYIQRIKELETEIGKWKSHAAHLEHERNEALDNAKRHERKYQNLNTETIALRKRVAEMREKDIIAELHEKIHDLRKELRQANLTIVNLKLHGK